MPEPIMALGVATILIVVAWWLFRPDRGAWARWQEARRDVERVRREDALKQIHKCEMGGRTPTIEGIAGALSRNLDETAALLGRMEQAEMLVVDRGQIRLTPEGRQSALHIIRAHRLWERYLADETGYEQSDWHGQAERLEHELTPADADALAARLGNPTHDPHGDPIPTAAGQLVNHGGQPLTAAPIDAPLRVVHVEDEPEVVYAQLMATGIHPGMVVRVVEATSRRLTLVSAEDEYVLAPLVAGNVSVIPVPAEEAEPMNGAVRLSTVTLGKPALVKRLSPACRGMERRRLLDLGILPGTVLRPEIQSAGGDPVAYRVRGALIALRKEQADLIFVEAEE